MAGPTETSTSHGRRLVAQILASVGHADVFELGLDVLAQTAAENTGSAVTNYHVVRDRARQAIVRAKASAVVGAEFAAGLIGAGWPRDLTAATGEDELLRVVTG